MTVGRTALGEVPLGGPDISVLSPTVTLGAAVATAHAASFTTYIPAPHLGAARATAAAGTLIAAVKNAGPPLPNVPVVTGWLTKTILSYLYQEYSDDEDLQAFVNSFNAMAQRYIDWFNQVNLPIYTGPLVEGDLLDWVAEGLYGIARPSLPFGLQRKVGPFNTWPFNTIVFNKEKFVGGAFAGGIGTFVIGITPIGGYSGVGPNSFATSDDTFRRVITWHFLKGDGKVFSIRWLKRRVMRFLVGADGINYDVDQTYRISVTFGIGNQVDIRILNSIITTLGSTEYNSFCFNTIPFNTLRSSIIRLPPFPEAPIFKAAVEAGVLELPFQFHFIVTI